MILNLVKEYIVCFAPGWPDPYRPTPNTKAEALHFCHQHGGKVMSRYRTAWKDEDTGARDYRTVLVSSGFESVPIRLVADADLTIGGRISKDRYGTL